MATNGGYSGGKRPNFDPIPPRGSGNSRIVTEKYARLADKAEKNGSVSSKDARKGN